MFQRIYLTLQKDDIKWELPSSFLGLWAHKDKLRVFLKYCSVAMVTFNGIKMITTC